MYYYKNYYYSTLKNFKSKKIFYRYSRQKKKYSDALKFSEKILKFIKSKNLKKKTILTFSNKSFEMYSSIFPILLSGNTWVPLSVNLPEEKVKNIVQQTKPDLCFYDYENKKIINLLKKIKVKCIKFKNIRENKEYINFKSEISKIDINSTAFIYFTSGSTGIPKGIKVSHKNIISDVFMQKKHLYNKS